MLWYCIVPSVCSSYLLSSIYTYIVFSCFYFQGLWGTLCALEALDVHLHLLNYCALLWCDVHTDVHDVRTLHLWHAHINLKKILWIKNLWINHQIKTLYYFERLCSQYRNLTGSIINNPGWTHSTLYRTVLLIYPYKGYVPFHE